MTAAMRIAFLTPEYPSETAAYGGLATYVARMSRLLAETGHAPEVFVPAETEGRIEHEGVTVHRVLAARSGGPAPRLLAGLADASRSFALHKLAGWLGQARSLADALERRHAEAPFALVQSADYTAPGLYVARRPDRVHAIRCSSAADLYAATDGQLTLNHRLRGWLELTSMRRADVAYAPSRFLADHFRDRHRMSLEVVRPPAAPPVKPAKTNRQLPPRYLVHFGQLMPRKGTEFITQALPLAWEMAPDLTMVWSGVCWKDRLIAEWRAQLGERAQQVLITGPLERRELAAVVARAEASVLPSQVDNLPNTVIESLALGVPVIGVRGASIDEIVEDGVTGSLVAFGDRESLAKSMVEAWSGTAKVSKGFIWAGGLRQEMEPARAVESLLALARRRTGG